MKDTFQLFTSMFSSPSLPRHSEIPDLLAKKICRSLEILEP